MSTRDPESSSAKAAARAEARARRREGPAPDSVGLAQQAMAFLESLPGPRRVTCYASYGTEPGTADMRARLAAAGFEVLLPRVRGDILEWVVDEGDSVVSSMGISEPAGASVDILPARAMLVPALAVTEAGDRLGKGGGYYDRVLAALGESAPPIAAVVGDADIVAALPRESHDRRVDSIVTPTQVITCR